MVPNEAGTPRPQSFRAIDTTAWSRRLVPTRLRHWSISVDVSTPRSEYSIGEMVPFAITMKNALPIPITVATRSRLLWRWDVDGLTEASHVEVHDATGDAGGFAFDRGERKRFRKRWDGMFRVSGSEWEPATPGEYTIGAGLNVDDAADRGLYDETTIRLVE